jgi:hypothetical protein
VQTPRFCGFACRAGLAVLYLTLSRLSSFQGRPFYRAASYLKAIAISYLTLAESNSAVSTSGNLRWYILLIKKTLPERRNFAVAWHI